jgi:autotransporter-associated beta strand protein
MMKLSRTLAAAATVAVLLSSTHSARAATWIGPPPSNGSLGGDWNTASNWDTNSVPNSAGASASFNGTNVTANRAYTFSANVTIGSLSISNNSAATNTYSVVDQVTPSLTFDSGVVGVPATVTVTGTNGVTSGTANLIRGAINLNSDLTVSVAKGTTTSAAGELSFQRGVLSGAYSITKIGTGTLTYADAGDKTYTGTTNINSGRLRLNGAAKVTGTSAITVASGAQFVLDGSADWTFGPATDPNDLSTIGTVITLNGPGLVNGDPIGFFPGAIRTGSGQTSAVRNKINLASDASIDVVSTNAISQGTLTLLNEVYGPGKFTANQRAGLISREGTVVFAHQNSYAGGTLVDQGTLKLIPNPITLATNTSLGTGNVYVDGVTPAFDGNPDGAASGKLNLDGTLTNAIADTATLTLTGGGTAGVADRGIAILGSGLNEIVGSLVLGGVAQGAGTYGATGSGATNIFDEYFSGGGIVTVVPPTVAGDFNGDGKVNAADYPTWRKSDGTAGGYATWRENFSQTSTSGLSLSASAVPEPNTCLLLTLMLSLWVASRRR